MVTVAARNNNTSDGETGTIDSPPRPVRTSSPRQGNNTSPVSPRSRHSAATSNNFRKYGSIRPPIPVLQNEFCTTYRLWEEHDAILRRVELKPSDRRFVNLSIHGGDGRNDWRKFKPRQVVSGGERRNNDHNSSSSGSSSDDDDSVLMQDEEIEWKEAFAHLRTLYYRHHHDYDNQEQQEFSLGNYQKNEFLESLCAIDDEDTLEEKLEEVDDNDEEVQLGSAQSLSETPLHSCEETQNIGKTNIAEQKQQQQKKRTDMENLAKLFRPGSKLSGTIETSRFSQDDYSLVIMEENECDELGRPKGYLARQARGKDEQCVFVHVKFVPLSDVLANNIDDGEEDSVDDEIEGKTADDIDGTDDNPSKSHNNLPPPQSQPPLEPEERITIQIEYVDGERSYWGYWNPNTLTFEGTVQKLGDGNNQGSTDRGGGMRNSASTNNVIMSGLISGRAVGVTDGEVSGTGGDNTDGVAATATGLSQRQKKQFTFSLSPCTHLHPRGRGIPPSVWQRFSMPSFRSMLGSEYLSLDDVGLFGVGFASNTKKKSKVSEQDQLAVMDELAFDDNLKFVLHRARTEQLLLDTLMKLAELGSLIDFAELARKRNVARRREKWRRRMRKVTPKMPRKFKRRKKKEVAGGVDISTLDSVEKKKVQFYDHLAVISWDRLLQAASIEAERTCATFRRRSALLDSLTFQSDEYKYQVMSDLRANGLTLASSHCEWDQCIQMGRTVALGWSWFERGSWGCFERSAVVGKRCVYLLFQMHSRLGVCHELLEKSFRGADARISIARLESFKQVRCDDKSEEDDSEEFLCGVCQCDIHEADGEDNKKATVVVTLPCSHSFHWNCIQEWLHDHSKCPICRVDLNE